MKNLRNLILLVVCTNFLFISSVIQETIYGNKELESQIKQTESFWTHPYDTYLFAPGILCAEYLIGKYCPFYETSTGQIVIGNQNFQTINGYTALSCNFAEIVLTDEKKMLSCNQKTVLKAFFEKNFYRFANYILLKKTLQPYNIFLLGDSKNDYTLKPYLIDFTKINFGQELDVQILSRNYDTCCNCDIYPSMVLYGNSRGAAAAFNFIALEYDNKTDKRVKVIILEGCFDAVRYVSWFNPLLKILPNYNSYGIAPIDPEILIKFVRTCNENSIAVASITSDADKMVPSANTKKLCMKLKEAGLKDFYLLELHRSGHRRYMFDDEEDMQRYQAFVHAFYKKYGLSHNARLAQEGSDELERCAMSYSNF